VLLLHVPWALIRQESKERRTLDSMIPETRSCLNQQECGTLACFSYTSKWADLGYQCTSYARSNLLGCYCLQQLTQALTTKGVWEGSRYILETELATCREWGVTTIVTVIVIVTLSLWPLSSLG
jgi:hypothetical protein